MLLVGLFGAVAIPFLLVTVSTTLGLTTYGDYSEIRANELAPILAATPDLSDVQIPMGIEYALLDKNYQLIETTLDENELEQAMRYATTGASDQNLQKRYLLVTRENEYVVLQYYIGAQYTNEWMNEHLPSPDILLIVLIAAGGILVCLLLTTRFAKKLRLQLVPLFEATSEVAKQNLDFEVGHSNIKEFEDVLISFSHMKESLKASLEQQWKAEQMQKEQIAALAQMAAQGNQDAASVLALCYTGFRVSEFLELSPASYDRENGILIGGGKTAAGKNRIVPVHPAILPYIDAWAKQNRKRLYTNGNGQAIGYETYRKAVSQIMAQIGCPDATAHWCRHTMASRLKRAGADPMIVKLILGHATGDITERYTHVTVDQLRENVLLLPMPLQLTL